MDIIGKSTRKNSRGELFWVCRCDCGTVKEIDGGCLRRGTTRSCGCLFRETTAAITKKYSPGFDYESEYNIWMSIKRRCLNPKATNFHNYGGRGITVCARWLQSFQTFLDDMGPRPSRRHCIERKNNGGNYEPGNCRWATYTEQNRNRRNNHLLTFRGETRTIAGWAEATGISRSTIQCRVARYGWDVERALTEP